MSIWGFLGGMADAGSKMLDDARKQRFFEMQQEAELKRQTALADLNAKNQLNNESMILKLKNDMEKGDYVNFHNAPDGSITAFTKSGEAKELKAGNPKWAENQNELLSAKIASMQANAEAATARMGTAGAQLELRKQALEQQAELAKERAAAEKEKNDLNAQLKKTGLWNSTAKAVQNEYEKDLNNIGTSLSPEELNSRVSARLNQAAQYAQGGGIGGPTGIAPPAAQVPTASSMTPGASPSMPLPVKPGDPRPPSGTYVIDTVTGRMGRVP